ncbi:MAG TPA: condensation domain-containing protein, partial [Albitalea sp.]|nr:condensation domain-containing protein [Albitalea sp.]
MSTLKNRVKLLEPEQLDKLRALAARGALGRPSRGSALTHTEHDDSVLSLPQRRLWLMSQLDTEAQAYNIPGAFVLNGPLDEEAFAAALHSVAARHEILRTTFYCASDGEPRQRIAKEPRIDYQYADRLLGDAPASDDDIEAWA